VFTVGDSEPKGIVDLRMRGAGILFAIALLTVVSLTACESSSGSGPSDDAGGAEGASSGSVEDTPEGAAAEFETDFAKHSVPYSDVFSGGPPKDGIPSIDKPRFVSVEEADGWIQAQEPVILLRFADEVRAYPIQIIIWHEIVNDTVNGDPITITFCPLCNTAIAFKGKLDGRDLDFGTTGRLRFSNLIMYDRQTETWWQQATGEAIVGELTGSKLEKIPAPIVSWKDLRSTHPNAKVLSRYTGQNRAYGENPYEGYDDIDSSPFLYKGPKTPDKLPPMSRVITVDSEKDSVAYPYQVLQEDPAINDNVAGDPIAVLWQQGTASALDNDAVDQGRDVGAAGVFSRNLDGQTLTFVSEGDKLLDKETGSEWNVLGESVAGEFEGERLEPVVSIDHFWFSWAAFRPETRVYSPKESES